MHDVFVSIPTNSSVTRLGIFYVYNHLLHKYGRVSRNNQPCFAEIGLRRFCIPAITHSSRIHCSNAVHIITCVNVWRQRRIYDSKTCETLESMVSSPSLSSTGEAHKDTSTFSVNSEIGGLKTLRYIFRMPMVDARYEEAVDGIDVDDLINTECLMHNQMLHEAKSRNKYHLFDQVSRLSGQEIILMNSISLDLAGLIEEGGKHLAMLEKDISDIQNRLKDFN
uniref:CID domain-containing protein n=1 Tax=Babesia bovis TaxID=5865 RepID=S6BKK9_BABBO|nr:conserved hypothetical protein [Babesia bovis]